MKLDLAWITSFSMDSLLSKETQFIGSDIFDFINQVSFFVKRQAKNICQASLFSRPKWPLGIFVKTHGEIQVLPKSTFIWTVIDLRLYEHQFESSSNVYKYIFTFLFVKYWATGLRYHYVLDFCHYLPPQKYYLL